MKQNMGYTDKAIRIILALAIAVFYFFDIINGTLAVSLGVLAVIFFVTSFVTFSPLYTILNINTCKIKK